VRGSGARLPDINLVRMPDVVLECVAYIGTPMHVGVRDSALFYHGSAFVVSVRHGGMIFFYLVTARHVAEKVLGLPDPVARMNDIRGKPFEADLRHIPHAVAERLGLPKNDDWHEHDDPSVDLAVRSFSPRHDSARRGFELPKLRGIGHVPDYMFVKDRQFSRNGLGVGDEVYIPSLFSFAKGERSNSPILRVGNLAMIPKERVKSVDAAFGPMEAYLIEARSLSGMSGAPVLIRETVALQKPSGKFERFDQRRPQFHGGGKFYLLGVIHGHWDVRAEAANESEPQVELDRKVSVNVGVAIVTPARKIANILNKEVFVKDRERTAAERHNRLQTATLDSVDEAQDNSTAKFDRTVSALFQVPKDAESKRPKRAPTKKE
jgi:hypothetical protein